MIELRDMTAAIRRWLGGKLPSITVRFLPDGRGGGALLCRSALTMTDGDHVQKLWRSGWRPRPGIWDNLP